MRRFWVGMMVMVGLGPLGGVARAQGNGVSLPASIAAVQPATGYKWGVDALGKSLVVLPPVWDKVAMMQSKLPVAGKTVCYALRTYEFEVGAGLADAPKLKGQTTCVASAETRTRDVRGARVMR